MFLFSVWGVLSIMPLSFTVHVRGETFAVHSNGDSIFANGTGASTRGGLLPPPPPPPPLPPGSTTRAAWEVLVSGTSVSRTTHDQPVASLTPGRASRTSRSQIHVEGNKEEFIVETIPATPAVTEKRVSAHAPPSPVVTGDKGSDVSIPPEVEGLVFALMNMRSGGGQGMILGERITRLTKGKIPVLDILDAVRPAPKPGEPVQTAESVEVKLNRGRKSRGHDEEEDNITSLTRNTKAPILVPETTTTTTTAQTTTTTTTANVQVQGHGLDQTAPVLYNTILFILNRGYQEGRMARMLCGGGDGTVSFCYDVIRRVLETAQVAPENFDRYYPAFFMLPLGTGNDLARSTGWGGDPPEGDGGMVIYLKHALSQAKIFVPFTTWGLSWVRGDACSDVDPETGLFRDMDAEMEALAPGSLLDADGAPARIPLKLFLYASAGEAARMAYTFAQRREAGGVAHTAVSSLAGKRTANIVLWGQIGAANTFHAMPIGNAVNARGHSKVDGEIVRDVPYNITKLLSVDVLNVPSIAGGWGEWGPASYQDGTNRSFNQPNFGDDLLEVAGVSSFKTFVKAQLAPQSTPGVRLGQVAEMCMSWPSASEESPAYLQVDGEGYEAVTPGSVRLASGGRVWAIVGQKAVETGKSYPFQAAIQQDTWRSEEQAVLESVHGAFAFV